MLGSPGLVAPLSPSLLAGGSLSAPRGTLGCCVQGVAVPPPTQRWFPCRPWGVSALFFLCSILLLLCICSQIPLFLPPSAPLPVPGCLPPCHLPPGTYPLPGGGDTQHCRPGDPHACHIPEGGGSTQDPRSGQCRQGAWTGMVTVALAPWRARLGTRSPPGRPWHAAWLPKAGSGRGLGRSGCQAAGHCGTPRASFHSAALFWFKK